VATPPETCPECGALVPRNARACPDCGADDQTGWSDRAQAQRLGISDDPFDYDSFVQEEFGSKDRTVNRIKPRGMRWIWWCVALLILLALAYSFLARGF
jgi:hypothetical protein